MRKRRRPKKWRPRVESIAGPVIITQIDGTTEIQPALSQQDLQLVVKDRHVNESQRRFILKRDNYRCRYCGFLEGPFHIDHVIPVTLGGSNKSGNLVTACESCNLTKGIAIWKPKPLGFWNKSK